MTINMNVDEEALQQAVASAIINTAFGENIKEVVEQDLRSMFSHYDSAVKTAIRQQIVLIATQYIRDNYADEVRRLVGEMLTEEMLKQFISMIFKKYIEGL